MNIDTDDLLTFKETMGVLRVSRSTLYRLMWSGQLPGHKVGSGWRFYRSDVRKCPKQETPVPPPSAYWSREVTVSHFDDR